MAVEYTTLNDNEFRTKRMIENLPFILNTLAMLFCAVLVMWMAAGFCLLEVGLVRRKNALAICVKNTGLFAVSCLVYLLIGYSIMYGGGEIFVANGGGDTSGDYAVGADIFFQMVFVATVCSIVSGTIAERNNIGAFLIFVAVLGGVLYPIIGSWTWGGGWLSEMGFSDFAGSAIVHGAGGAAALASVLVIGARQDKYDAKGRPRALPGSNIPMATAGTFVLWMGWFGFNGGSVLAASTSQNLIDMSNVMLNTNIAACGGLVAALIYSYIVNRRYDTTLILNGALAGLVSITAGPDYTTSLQSVFIGAIGGVLASITVPLLDKMKIDDVVGAIPVHFVGGLWGTLAVGIFGDASILIQLLGFVSITGFIFVTTFITYKGLSYLMEVRVDQETEVSGLDQVDCGNSAYDLR